MPNSSFPGSCIKRREVEEGGKDRACDDVETRLKTILSKTELNE